jgi:hypothetical protein
MPYQMASYVRYYCPEENRVDPWQKKPEKHALLLAHPGVGGFPGENLAAQSLYHVRLARNQILQEVHNLLLVCNGKHVPAQAVRQRGRSR